jgi:23S rRNA-/tRNA-specific pseudouridylate synthase
LIHFERLVGVIVLARDADTHRTLSMSFEARAVDKTYEALVSGGDPLFEPRMPADEWDAELAHATHDQGAQ